MRLKSTIAVVAVACLFAPALAHAGMSDFYVTNTLGQVSLVDGQTLESSQVSQLGNVSNLNEILYLGNGEIVASLGGDMLRHNLNTGEEEFVFRLNQNLEPGSLGIGSGLAMTSAGDIFFTASVFSSGNPTEHIAGSYNLTSGEFVNIVNVNTTTTFFDHQQIGENAFLAASFSDQSISILNASTGELDTTFDVGFGVVSLFESDGSIFAMGRNGDLYTFDAITGETSFLGGITGTVGDLIGATVPAPGTLSLLGILGLGATRRRR
jgi:hypothetical protein